MSHLLELREVLGARPLFSVGAGVCLLNHAGRLLLQQRGDSGLWGLPGGSAEPGESLLDNVRRELREETGIDLPPEAFEVLMLIDGPEYHHKYPNGHEVYYVGAVYTARVAEGFELPAHSDTETLALAFFDLHDLPWPLSGPIELAAVRRLRERANLPLTPAPTMLREPPPPGEGYMRMIRAAVGTRPVFSVGAAILVLDEAGRVLLQRRADGGAWGVPGGSSELGERFEDTARRELHEETGVQADQLEFAQLLMGPEYYYRYPHGDEIHNVAALYLARVPSDVALAPVAVDAGAGETLELRFFALNDLPAQLAGPVTRSAIRYARVTLFTPV